MFKIIFSVSLLFVISSTSLAEFKFDGILNGQPVNLVVNELGALKNNAVYEYQITNHPQSLKYEGIFFEVDSAFSLTQQSKQSIELISSQQKPQTKIGFQMNNSVRFMDGTWLNKGVSLRLENRSADERWVTGFYSSLITDTRIYIVNNQSVYLKGYMRDHWIDLNIETNGDFFVVSGEYLGQKITGKLYSDFKTIDDFIEYLFFGFHIENTQLFL